MNVLRNKKTPALLLLLAYLLPCLCIPVQASGGRATIKDIVVTMGPDAASRFVTWQSDSGLEECLELYPLDETGARSDAPAQTLLSSPAYHPCADGFWTYRARLDGLFTGNRAYDYRVGSPSSGWSGYYRLTSPLSDGDGSFSFLLAGDAQIGSRDLALDAQSWSDTLEKGQSWFGSQIEFLISAGDQADVGNFEPDYDGFFTPTWLRTLPMAAIPGNHDGWNLCYSDHFTLPNTDGVGATAGTYSCDYWFAYDGVLFLCLNTNEPNAQLHAAFLDRAIRGYTAAYGEPNWKVAVLHHSLYSTAKHSGEEDIVALRQALPPVFSDLGIDLVLQGHDHVYTRTYLMRGTEPVTDPAVYTPVGEDPYGSVRDPEEGLVQYLEVGSSSGSKHYEELPGDFPFALVHEQSNTPNLTKIDVTPTSLCFTTYYTGEDSTVSDVVDTFQILHTDAAAVPEPPPEQAVQPTETTPEEPPAQASPPAEPIPLSASEPVPGGGFPLGPALLISALVILNLLLIVGVYLYASRPDPPMPHRRRGKPL